ncbi:TadE/TadG family type IV pilus assembly protein [Roseibium sp.]|uniref:TadE/TadG family type IV pilus assembly protein n=1 Tax=Roseibium sp. TaxID=1936156 RepID=UPI003D0E10F3
MRLRSWQFRKQGSKRLRSLLKDRSGVTAIEFSMIAIPFFILAFGIIEVGLAHFANRMVDNAVISASRLIRTGQAKDGTLTSDDFRTQICNFMPDFLCNKDRITVEVQSVGTFAEAGSTKDLYDKDGKIREDLKFATGGAGDIVVVNVIYKWPMITAVLNLDKGDRGKERHLTSTMVFRNEPWE